MVSSIPSSSQAIQTRLRSPAHATRLAAVGTVCSTLFENRLDHSFGVNPIDWTVQGVAISAL